MNKMIITLPDGTEKDLETGSTGYDIAKSIGEGLLRNSIAIKANNKIIDLYLEVITILNAKLLISEGITKSS